RLGPVLASRANGLCHLAVRRSHCGTRPCGRVGAGHCRIQRTVPVHQLGYDTSYLELLPAAPPAFHPCRERHAGRGVRTHVSVGPAICRRARFERASAALTHKTSLLETRLAGMNAGSTSMPVTIYGLGTHWSAEPSDWPLAPWRWSRTVPPYSGCGRTVENDCWSRPRGCGAPSETRCLWPAC